MSANRLKHSQSGFTLIEVTLAIVIGVVVIAGATVLYNQAKSSAANTAANSKVNALAATVEEYAARNFGKYPDATGLRNMWKRNRPDDFNTSPWGGLAGAKATVVVDGISTSALAADITAATTADPELAGSLRYDTIAPGATRNVFDVQTSNSRAVRGYAVWIFDQNGVGPNFVKGGEAPQP